MLSSPKKSTQRIGEKIRRWQQREFQTANQGRREVIRVHVYHSLKFKFLSPGRGLALRRSCFAVSTSNEDIMKCQAFENINNQITTLRRRSHDMEHRNIQALRRTAAEIAALLSAAASTSPARLTTSLPPHAPRATTSSNSTPQIARSGSTTTEAAVCSSSATWRKPDGNMNR